MDCVCLAWDRDKWEAVGNAFMNLRVPKYARKILTSKGFISFFKRDSAL